MDSTAAEKWLADENSDVDENTVIVLRGYGPKGAPGMPEFGNYLPVPPKLHKKGIDDYLRVTAFPRAAAWLIRLRPWGSMNKGRNRQ